ncbi:septal ring lytic transglycosylase RlpA family protein [Acidobacteriota bacterium]
MKYFSSGDVQTGLASWYGDDFHGKMTSNKEIYNMYDMTAAHKSLPFDTYVMVTNRENGRSVTVRINDRGPFIKGRIIDLSYAAAKVLHMIGPGVVRVRIEVLRNVSPKKRTQKYLVQVGSYIVKKNAKILRNKLRKNYRNIHISEFKTPHQVYYRVRIKARSMENAKKIAKKLFKEGYVALVLEEGEI